MEYFYFNRLDTAQQQLYTTLLQAFRQQQSLPLRACGPALTDRQVEDVWWALFFDHPALPWPERKAFYIFLQGGTYTLAPSSQLKPSTQVLRLPALQMDRPYALVRRYWHLRHDPRSFLIALSKYFHQHSLYYTNNFSSTQPQTPLELCYGNCSAVSRLVTIIARMAELPVVCVRGKIRHHASAVTLEDSPFSDVPHAWNALKTADGWLFFDMITQLACASRTQISEIHDGFIKSRYDEEDFSSEDFFTAPTSPRWHQIYTVDTPEAFL